MFDYELDSEYMARALELAERGQGSVEPNPMVGCLIVRDGAVVGEGWHSRFGGPHAEVVALAQAGNRARGSTLYVTLEPCCHQGKTPPCTEAVIAAGVARVVVALPDPFPQVSGRGIAALRAAGIETEIGVRADDARRLNAPYLKLLASGLPWVIAKWAMTLDGKLADASGGSKWISGELAREMVHQLRGRVDGILVGRGTAVADDPLLTARPAGRRVATRIILDTRGELASNSRLVKSAREVPVLVVIGAEAPQGQRDRLTAAGCEVFLCQGSDSKARLNSLLSELGRRRMTNLLVEGGSRTLGAFFDAGQIDEVWAFIAPRIIGGAGAFTPIGGEGISSIANALALSETHIQQVGSDVLVRGLVPHAKLQATQA